MPMTDGKTTSLDALLTARRAVPLNFWYVGCTWCGLEFPGFESVYEQSGDELAIDNLGGSTMLPMTVIIDPEGTITYNKVGSVTDEFLEAKVKYLLNE